jgi:hypothetical protein
MAGFRVKKLTGLKLTFSTSQGITGKSSMRGTWGVEVLVGGCTVLNVLLRLEASPCLVPRFARGENLHD